MEFFLYIIMFLIGIYFGSFFTLAVYRIPKKENITYKHSYCPNCNHKLGMLDLVPVFSYLFLGAKCRYCKQKIRPRYFLLEILSGIVFVLFTASLKIDLVKLDMNQIIYLTIGILYFASLFILAGIDKEKNTICKSVLAYNLFVCLLYMIYSCTMNYYNVYAYVIYLILIIILLMINNYKLKKKLEQSYIVEILILLISMTTISKEYATIFTIMLTLFSIGIYLLLKKVKDRNRKMIVNHKEEKLPIAFFLCVSNIIVIILSNFICNFKLV